MGGGDMRTMGYLALVAAVATSTSCAIAVGSGNLITEIRHVSGFERISLEGSGVLTIIQGDKESLVIEAEDNIMPRIKSVVENGELILGLEHHPFETLRLTKEVKYTLTARDISGLSVSGSGSIDSKNIKSNGIGISIAGSGNVDIGSLDAEVLSVAIAGSGSCRIKGNVSRQTISIAGSGDFDGGELRSDVGAVSISGSGDAEIWATESLSAKVSGSGDVLYRGSPSVTTSVDGSGEVVKIGASGI
jgi:hypothetical protein